MLTKYGKKENFTKLLVAHFGLSFVNHSFYFYYFFFFEMIVFNNFQFSITFLQNPKVDSVIRPVRSYFPSATKKVCHHSRAGWQNHNMQLTGNSNMVQHLAEGMTSTLLTTQTATLVHSQTLATPTLFQVEYLTRKQSLLGLINLYQMRWKCFTVVSSR